ncbi:hypothetical protein OQJ13_10360 [Legionella sp. PATHC035]|uniref:hypothetical protein n=1 Tax=Legionella sp. PATHC035 TaxID=2992040 RepID=UPI002244F4AE|nr:hypothetical protein [Legionella sp. PATHC035]MCW8409376.1 hypothetical protein [Legionella sp. PATHC035]
MASPLSRLSGFNKDVRLRLKNAIRSILSLDEEYISYDCYNAFDILKKAVWQAEIVSRRTDIKHSVLDFLTDDDLFRVIAEFEKSLPKVLAEIEEMKAKVVALKPLEQQNQEIKNRKTEADRTIDSKQRILDKTPIPKEPGGWSKFIADKSPGPFKSLFLLLVPQKSIEAAQKLCDDYELASQTRERLVVEIETLRRENTTLKTDLDSKDEQIKGLKSTQQFLNQSEKNLTTLQENLKVLKENAAILIPSEQQEHMAQTLAQKQNEEDDDLQFSMEM